MDVLSLLGIVLAFAAVLGGNFLEGGHADALLNLPAAVIVIGGTLGAGLLQTPMPVLRRALRVAPWVFAPPPADPRAVLRRVVTWSRTARREGLLGLEQVAEREKDQFAQRGLQLLVDGSEPEAIRRAMEMELVTREQRGADAARVFRSLGGYAPTIGIIGAVMGLIQVLGNLEDASALGSGIATAFVATIYGIGLANLVFLPMSDKLLDLVRRQSACWEMTIEGVIAIAEGENPRAIELRLGCFIEQD